MFPRAAQRRFLIPLILVSFAVATAFVNVQQVTTSSAPINSCSFVAPPVGSTDDGGYIYITLGRYEVRVESKDGAIVTVVKNK